MVQHMVYLGECLMRNVNRMCVLLSWGGVLHVSRGSVVDNIDCSPSLLVVGLMYSINCCEKSLQELWGWASPQPPPKPWAQAVQQRWGRWGRQGLEGIACGGAPQESLAKAAGGRPKGKTYHRIRVLRARGIRGLWYFCPSSLSSLSQSGWRFILYWRLRGSARAQQRFIPVHHMI